jgi:hypothetical protein
MYKMGNPFWPVVLHFHIVCLEGSFALSAAEESRRYANVLYSEAQQQQQQGVSSCFERLCVVVVSRVCFMTDGRGRV